MVRRHPRRRHPPHHCNRETIGTPFVVSPRFTQLFRFFGVFDVFGINKSSDHTTLPRLFLNTNRTNMLQICVLFDFLEIFGIKYQIDFREILSEATFITQIADDTDFFANTN